MIALEPVHADRILDEGVWTSIDAGYFHTCGIKADRLHCWGRNNFGQLGIGNLDNRNVPALVGASDYLEGVPWASGFRETSGS